MGLMIQFRNKCEELNFDSKNQNYCSSIGYNFSGLRIHIKGSWGGLVDKYKMSILKLKQII
jgi:hypothetical protein